MSKKRPYALSIAGFDPSGGAGVTADLKTFEAHKVQGLGVCTAITYQNDREFDGLEWLPKEQIQAQLNVLLRQFKVDVAKIGLIQNLDTLLAVASQLKQHNPNIRLIWDPILRASAGFTFHGKLLPEEVEQVCQQLFLITPNWVEMEQLVPDAPAPEGAKQLSKSCHVLLKGGHNEQQKGRDFLYAGEKVLSFRPKRVAQYGKHGSGCVLSAALTALLAAEYPLQKACLKAKNYVTRYLESSNTLLGHHKI